MKKLLIITTSILALCSSNSIAQGIGNGSAGTAAISGVINNYAAVSSFNNTQASTTSFTVDTASFFNKGDLVLVIQMKGGIVDTTNTSKYGNVTDFKNTGRFEYVKVDSVGGTLVRTSKIQNNYDTGSAVVIQLVRVPQYEKATIADTLKGMPWNGKKGGVIAVDAADSIILKSFIKASGIGFRGATPRTDGTTSAVDTNYKSTSGRNAMKGEGIAGRGDDKNIWIFGRGNIANGGGGGNNHNAGGGGGSNIGCGGFGGWGTYNPTVHLNSRGIGGMPFAAIADSGKVAFMGGGGGAGQVNDNFMSTPGNGGGIVILTTNAIEGNNYSIEARGTNATHNNGYDGAAGGGGGGSVLLFATDINKLDVTCVGGNGGNPKNFINNQHHTAPGGGGGGGLINVKKLVAGTGNNFNVMNGKAGICDTSNYGATDGCPGVKMDMLVIKMPNPLPQSVKAITDNKLNFNFGPNPAGDYVELMMPGEAAGKSRLSIFDIKGRECYNMIFEGNTQKIQVSNLPAGVYILKVSNDHGVGMGKMVKQ